jgi:hypothetical protein
MISAVISYCSIDRELVCKCIDSILGVCDEIIVVYCDCLFDGTPDPIDPKLIERYNGSGSDGDDSGGGGVVKFVLVPFVSVPVTERFAQRPAMFWHCMVRYVGYTKACGDYILSLDSDEIMDPVGFRAFVTSGEYTKYSKIRFAAYWYYREPTFRARTVEKCCSMIKRDIALNRGLTFHPLDRSGCFTGEDDETVMFPYPCGVLCHHFSWVRTPELLFKKIKVWGHNPDRDWHTMLTEDLSKPFGMTDCVNHYDYDIVNDEFDIGPQGYERYEHTIDDVVFRLPKGQEPSGVVLSKLVVDAHENNVTRITLEPVQRSARTIPELVPFEREYNNWYGISRFC